MRVNPKFVIALDVGFSHTGYAVWNLRRQSFSDFGTFSSERDPDERVSLDYSRRARVLATSLRELFKEYSPEFVVAEMPSGGAKSSRAAVQMAMSAAIVSTVCHLSGLPLVITNPIQSKKVVRTTGSVSKEEVQSWVLKRFNVRLPERAEIREHVADAMMALEVCYRHYPQGKSIYG